MFDTARLKTNNNKTAPLSKIKRGSLFVYIFSIPFEYWDPLSIVSFFSITKIAAVLYLSISIISTGKSFDFKIIWPKVRLLCIFWFFLFINSVFHFDVTNNQSPFDFTLPLNFLIYWLIGSDLLGKRIYPTEIFKIFTFSLILIQLLLFFNIGIDIEYIEGVSRLSFFNNNSNNFGVMISLAIIFCIYLFIRNDVTKSVYRYIYLAVLPGFFSLLIATGSRGSIFTSIIGVSVLLSIFKINLIKKTLYVSTAAISLFYFSQSLGDNALIKKRMEKLFNEGDSQREMIWDSVLKIIYENPLFGTGITGYEQKIIHQLGYYKDPHNLFLFVLVTTGLFGLSLFMSFLIPHITKSYEQYRKGSPIYIVLMLVYFTVILKTGAVIGNKLMWLLLATIMFSVMSRGENKSQAN